MIKENETMIVVTKDARQAAKIGAALTGLSQTEFAVKAILEAAKLAQVNHKPGRARRSE